MSGSAKSTLRIAAEDNSIKALELIEGNKADVVLLIYHFDLFDGADRYTHIQCRDDVAFRRMQAYFPEAKLNPMDPGQTYFVLYLPGPGTLYRERLFELLPKDDSWSFNDFRMNKDDVFVCVDERFFEED